MTRFSVHSLAGSLGTEEAVVPSPLQKGRPHGLHPLLRSLLLPQDGHHELSAFPAGRLAPAPLHRSDRRQTSGPAQAPGLVLFLQRAGPLSGASHRCGEAASAPAESAVT